MGNNDADKNNSAKTADGCDCAPFFSWGIPETETLITYKSKTYVKGKWTLPSWSIPSIKWCWKSPIPYLNCDKGSKCVSTFWGVCVWWDVFKTCKWKYPTTCWTTGKIPILPQIKFEGKANVKIQFSQSETFSLNASVAENAPVTTNSLTVDPFTTYLTAKSSNGLTYNYSLYSPGAVVTASTDDESGDTTFNLSIPMGSWKGKNIINLYIATIEYKTTVNLSWNQCYISPECDDQTYQYLQLAFSTTLTFSFYGYSEQFTINYQFNVIPPDE